MAQPTHNKVDIRTLGRRDMLRGLAAVGAAGLFSVPILSACGSDDGKGSSGGADTSGDSATPSGSITVYSTTLPPIQAKLEAAFKKNTGVTVSSLRLTTSALEQRFIAEQKSRNYACDVMTCGEQLFFDTIGKQGILTNLDNFKGVSTLAKNWHSSSYYVQLGASPNGILYNTKTVTGDSIPKGWNDLLKPEFKGQMVFPDPRANAVVVPEFLLLLRTYGEDFLRQLGKQDLKLVPAQPQGVNQIIAGDLKLAPFCPPVSLVGMTGPIALATPYPTPTTSINFYSGVPAHAPNPVAAKAWLEFTLTEEAQAILFGNNLGISALGSSVPGSLPSDTKLDNPSQTDANGQKDHIFDLLGLAA